MAVFTKISRSRLAELFLLLFVFFGLGYWYLESNQAITDMTTEAVQATPVANVQPLPAKPDQLASAPAETTQAEVDLASWPANLTAEAIYVAEVNSQVALYTKNPDKRLLPASTTKMMTALVALEIFALDELITITAEEDSIGNSVDFARGEVFRVEDLLAGVLISSGNDAALSLARAHPQGYQAFIDQMNQKARQLGLHNTQFSNVSGLESYQHYSSARDLSLIGRQLLAQPLLRRLVNQRSYHISNFQDRTYYLWNTNQLLARPEVIGIKTGWTDNAGECLVTAVQVSGKEVIIVVLNSQDRFGESSRIIDWVLQQYDPIQG